MFHCYVRLPECIFYFAGQLCILVQEDNPFKLPSDDKIFAMREEERQRRAEERERVKHLHVWEKVSLCRSWCKGVVLQRFLGHKGFLAHIQYIETYKPIS